MHPDTEIRFINNEIGYGVVATKFIPKGTITWVQDQLDRIFTPSEVENLNTYSQQMLDKFSFRNNQGNFVLCWDLAKYVNHSFRSNCLSTAYDFEIAIRDIHPGEELTDDYGYLNVTEAFHANDEGTERTVVYPDDLLHYHEEWDEKVADAFSCFKIVVQPLEMLIADKYRKTMDMILEGKMKPDSILVNYYQETAR